MLLKIFETFFDSTHIVYHCVKSVQIRSFFWSVFSGIQTRKNSVYGHFPRSVCLCFSGNMSKIRIGMKVPTLSEKYFDHFNSQNNSPGNFPITQLYLSVSLSIHVLKKKSNKLCMLVFYKADTPVVPQTFSSLFDSKDNVLIKFFHDSDTITAMRMKFSITDFFSKCDQIRRELRILSHLLKKFLMENFIFCAVYYFLIATEVPQCTYFNSCHLMMLLKSNAKAQFCYQFQSLLIKKSYSSINKIPAERMFQ